MPSLSWSLAPGTRIGELTVHDAIGSGGFGTVYRAEHHALARTVAVKVMHPELAGSRDAFARFQREIVALRRVRHANVVDLYETGVLPDGRIYLVMELLRGLSLEALSWRRGALPVGECLELLEPLCDALSTVHANGIVHRDVKASNVILASRADGRARPVLTDFGVAKLVDAGNTEESTSRIVVGTPSCMAPEQILGDPIDARTDVYGVGSLAFVMLTGEPPFRAESVTLAQYLHAYARRPRPSSLDPAAAPLDDVVVRAMSIDPAARFASIEDLRRALVGAASVEARP